MCTRVTPLPFPNYTLRFPPLSTGGDIALGYALKARLEPISHSCQLVTPCRTPPHSVLQLPAHPSPSLILNKAACSPRKKKFEKKIRIDQRNFGLTKNGNTDWSRTKIGVEQKRNLGLTKNKSLDWPRKIWTDQPIDECVKPSKLGYTFNVKNQNTCYYRLLCTPATVVPTTSFHFLHTATSTPLTH